MIVVGYPGTILEVNLEAHGPNGVSSLQVPTNANGLCRTEAGLEYHVAGFTRSLPLTPFDSQVIRHRENVRDGVGAHIDQVLIPLIGYDALQCNVTVLHDDVNRWQRPITVARRE